MRRSVCIPAAILLLAGGAACVGGLPPSAPPTNPIRFVSLNDVYTADTLPDGSGGLARVAAMRDRIALEGPTLFVLAGDVLSHSVAGYDRNVQFADSVEDLWNKVSWVLEQKR